MAKKRKFASGGDIEYMSPEENETLAQKNRPVKRRLVSSVLKYTPRSVRYDSIRPKDFEENIKNQKREAIEEGIAGGSKASSVLPALASVPMAGPAGIVSEMGNIRSGVNQMRDAYRKYRDASESEDAAERELDAQNRREARGMKKGGVATSLKAHAALPASKAHAGMKAGGFVKAADGIASKGKTKATQVVMAGGKGMKRGGMC